MPSAWDVVSEEKNPWEVVTETPNLSKAEASSELDRLSKPINFGMPKPPLTPGVMDLAPKPKVIPKTRRGEQEIKPLAKPGVLGSLRDIWTGNLQTGDTPISRALGKGVEPLDERQTPTQDLPMARFDTLAPEKPSNRIEGFASGTAKFATGMTTAPSVLMLAGTGGLGTLSKAAATNVIPRLISAGFSLDMIRGAYERYPELKKAMDSGDTGKVWEVGSQIGWDVLFAAGAAKHAATGSLTGTERRNRLTQMEERIRDAEAKVTDATATPEARDAARAQLAALTEEAGKIASGAQAPIPIPGTQPIVPPQTEKQKQAVDALLGGNKPKTMPTPPVQGLGVSQPAALPTAPDVGGLLGSSRPTDIQYPKFVHVEPKGETVLNVSGTEVPGDVNLSTGKKLYREAPQNPVVPSAWSVKSEEPTRGDWDVVSETSSAEPTPVPEQPKTNQIQAEQLADGKRNVMLFTPGEQPTAKTEGMAQLDVPGTGTFYYRPEAITPEAIHTAVRDGKLNEILGDAQQGMGAPSKAEVLASGEPPVVVSARDAEGTAAQSTLTTPERVPETVAAQERLVPEGGAISVEPPEVEIGKRVGAAQSETPAPPRGVMPQVPQQQPSSNVISLPTDQIEVDAPRFQFKRNVGQGGAGAELKEVGTWDPELAGVVSVWKDPANGKTYIVNGHHRLDLAKRLNVPSLDVRYIEAATAGEARAKGALINIAEGRGDAVDAAKIFRDFNIGPAELQAKGISMRGPVARDGMALSKLSPPIFQMVVDGDIPLGRGAIIGSMLDNPADQKVVVDLIAKREKSGGHVTEGLIRELIDSVKNGPHVEREDSNFNLFGDDPVTESLALERADLADYIGKRLSQEKRLFSTVGTEGNAKRLAKAGNQINAEQNAKVAQDVSEALAVYGRLKNSSGPIAEALDGAARDVAHGAKPSAVREGLYEQIRSAVSGEVSRVLGRGQGEVPGGLPSSDASGSGSRGSSEPGLFGGEVEQPRPPLGLRPENAGERGAANLNVIGAGVPAFVQQDVIPKIASVAKAWVEAKDDILKYVAPAGRSAEASTAAGDVRFRAAEMAQRTDRAHAALEQASKVLGELPDQAKYDFINKIETGQRQSTPELQGIADTMRQILDGRRADVQALGNDKLKTFYQDYFPHIWKDPKKAQQFIMDWYSKRPMEGSKSFLKKRTIPTIADGIAAGLEPVSTNPVDLVLLKTREMDKYIMAHRAFNDLKAQGLLQFVRASQKAPDSYAQINDNIAVVYGPRTGAVSLPPGANIAPGDVSVYGQRIMGRYYAPEPVARVINNYLSPGLRGKAAFRGYLTLANSLNQFQLGWSAFHLGFTSMDAATSKFALGIYKMAHGKPLAGLVDIARTADAPFTNILRGDKMMKEWLKPGTQGAEVAQMVDAVVQAGGRAKMDSFYQTQITKRMQEAWKAGNIWGAALRAPFALTEQASRPIMEYIVPRQKMGVFADLAKFELERLGPNATPEATRAALARAWDSVDNRMGQLVYDNLFWNKAVKDLAMASVRSVGWNVGTARELAGGATDWVKFAKTRDFTPRMSYTLALPILTGMIGGMMTYLYTGKGPEELKDYFFPKTGNLDEHGRPERVSLPSYMKDVYHYTFDPGQTIKNKLHPAIGTIAEMLSNRDYYGTKIRNEDDPLVQQGLDLLKHAAGAGMPFAVRGLQKEAERGASWDKKVLPFIGVTPAPSDINKTQAEKLMDELADERKPQGTRTKEQAERSKARAEIIRGLRLKQNVTEKEREGLRSGVLRPSDIRNMANAARTPGLVNSFKYLDIEDALKVWDKANPDEQKLLLPALRNKISSAIKNRGPEERTVLMGALRRINGSGRGSMPKPPSNFHF